MTKEIRLLTGRHAGARVTLNAMPTVIGNDEQSDIQISDWDQPAMQVIRRDDGSLAIATGEQSSEVIVMEDFKPRRFGSVVLCAGDAQAQWPSDIELLETLLSPSSSPAPVPMALAANNELAAAAGTASGTGTRRGIHAAAVAGIALMAIGCAGIALPAVLHPRGKSTLEANVVPPTAATLQRVLDRLHEPDVTVTQIGGRFAVVGIVPDSAHDAPLRTALEAVAPGKIVWRLGCADQIARDLQESLHEPALKVSYRGQREFAITGVAKNANAVHETLDRMSADLAPMVKRIDQQFALNDSFAAPANVESALAVDTLQYVEASDGTKQFIDSHTDTRHTNGG
ncbi:MAG TPA: HrpD5 family protein [Trinickia sp.]|uniref:HrpD5 family protein n=1 Tax=Trinickia sp. TaxID=2571163 RepID=UPI002C31C4E1|nr:HrpD5 family protein [Trinickia sp.]HVW50442.1 HrpD5 family protein [Trinickia sp.]